MLRFALRLGVTLRIFFAMSVLFSTVTRTATSTAAGATVLPLDQGLTLAETRTQPARVLLVLRDHGDAVDALDLSDLSALPGDAAALLQQLGASGIRALARAHESRAQRVDHQQLGSPAGAGRHHIALGFNYPEHADEVQQAAQPFLFLKRSLASREPELVSAPDQLLDYEVEICARVLSPASADEAATQMPVLGFFLCGDFTDRALLLRQMDHDDIGSGRGFGVAKSQPGFFPAGPWLVVPDDPAHFARHVQLSLSVNGELRQLAAMREMVWDLPRILSAVRDARREGRATHFSDTPDWLPQGRWQTDICILSGTPAGVVMRPPSTAFRLASGVLYVLGGAVLSETSLRAYAIERYIRQLRAERRFLQPGDRVAMQARYLGRIDLLIR